MKDFITIEELGERLKVIIEKNSLHYDPDLIMKDITKMVSDGCFNSITQIHMIKISEDKIFALTGKKINGEVIFTHAKFHNGPTVFVGYMYPL